MSHDSRVRRDPESMQDAVRGAGVQSASHWGIYRLGTDGREITAVTPWAKDTHPSPLLGNLPGSVTHPARIAAPAVRRGWWEGGPGPSVHRGTARSGGTGPGDYLTVGWDEVLDRLAAELRRVLERHGPEAIFGGSYGWGSAGRFHHAPAQTRRFLHALGGCTSSVGSYSTGVLEVLLPRIACPEAEASGHATTYEEIVEHTDLWLAFGGIPVKNTGVMHGGSGDHPSAGALGRFLARGGRLVGVTPLADDLPAVPRGGRGRAEQLSIRPGTDTALLLALCTTLITRGLYDAGFVATHTVGYDELAAYLLGDVDGRPKDAAWAAELCELPARAIELLADDLARGRSLVTATWSLQRARHGEQAVWALVALAALLGQVGLPGGGFGFGFGSMNAPGLPATPFRLPTLPLGVNPVATRIPVAAISELLLHPGRELAFDGARVRLPDIRCVYWAGGNPFHHHQDLNRLRRALARPDTVVVHDPYWTPMARHADIVIPSTTAAERDDLAGSRHGAALVAMRAAVPRHAQARDDYETFAALAARLGVAAEFTQGRTAAQWIRHLYEEWRDDLAHGRITPGRARLAAPTYEEFVARGVLELPTADPPTLLSAFRANPAGAPLHTPSGRIELASAQIGALGLADCPGHPTWLPPGEWDGATTYPLHVIANQPRARLHGQLDHGAASQATKVAAREPLRMHPQDARARRIASGDVVRVVSPRGAILAGAVLDDAVRPGVVQVATGAWYDPLDPPPVPPVGARPDPHAPGALCVHGNPNVLTADVRSSALAQGCAGGSAMVQVERFEGPVPPVRAFDPPQP